MKAIGAIASGERNRRYRLLLFSAAAVSVVAAAPAFAQGAAEQDQSVEEVVVTGSSIRGVAPVGSALISVGRDSIVAQGATSSSDLLSSVPQLGNFNVPQESSTPNRYRTSGYLPNIHGLGIYATLSLFNGHRFAGSGGEGVFPDPQLIPTIAIERVEVVADGASSIYGSDAVAGVVNFIYRKKFSGVEMSALYGGGNGSKRTDLGLIAGRAFGDSAGAQLAYQYTENTSPTRRDLPFTIADQRSRGGRDNRGTNCETPNVITGGVTYALPNFTVGANRCESNLDQEFVPSGKRHSALLTAYKNFGDLVETSVEVNYSKYDSSRRAGARAFSVDVPITNPYFQRPPGSTATTVRVARNSNGLFPLQSTIQHNWVAGVTLFGKVKLGADWQAEVMGHVSKTDDFNGDPTLNTNAATALALNTTRATAFNPYGTRADNDPAVLAQIDDGQASNNYANQYLRQLQLKADGPLFELPGGTVRAAVGGTIFEEQSDQVQTGGSPAAPILVRDSSISRTVEAAFGEVNVPFVSQANAMPGIQRLELSISGRYDHYEKLGGTVNPKFGVIYQPFNDLLLRGSWGSSYVAPNIGKITPSFGIPSVGNNIAGIGVVNIYNKGGGNATGLKSQKAKTWSVGAEYKPSYIEGLQLSATYFNVHYENLLYTPGQQELLFNPLFASKRIFNPTPAQVAAALASSPPSAPVPSQIDIIYETFVINLGEQNVSGLDLNANYTVNTENLGRFTFGMNASGFLVYDLKIFATDRFQSQLDTNNAIRWRGRTNLAWNYNKLTLNGFMNYTGVYNNIAVTPNQRVKEFVTFDLGASYQLRDNLQVQIRSSNIFDKEPPFYDGSSGYDTRSANPFGRQVELSLRARF